MSVSSRTNPYVLSSPKQAPYPLRVSPQFNAPPQLSDKRTGKAIGAVDAFTWQIAAILGFVIHQTCKFSNIGLQRALPKLAKTPRQFAVSLIGLGAIPFIIHPIDHAVDYVFDQGPRKYLYTL